jgi:hypothetical protein
MNAAVGTAGGRVAAVTPSDEAGPAGEPDLADLARPADLARRARAVLTDHWRPPGFCVPHPDVYPVLFCWDSCFHVVAWAALGEGERATSELRSVLLAQTEAGFVPHMAYLLAPEASVAFWGRRGSSTITQPPMYGHAVAEMARRGVPVPGDLVERAERGLRWLVDHRRLPDGSIAVVHPWETGMDDSPRWDHALAEPWTRAGWYRRKGELVESLVLDSEGVAVDNPAFRVGSAGFTALVAFNLLELGAATAQPDLTALGRNVAASLGGRFDGDGWSDGGRPSVRTLDGLLPLLVLDSDHAGRLIASLVDPGAFGGRYGPSFVHRAEPSFDPTSYWRGSAWAQVTYLMWLGARRHGAADVAGELAAGLRRGVAASGFAEHWHPDTGAGYGAAPLSWDGLVVAVE